MSGVEVVKNDRWFPLLGQELGLYHLPAMHLGLISPPF